MEPTKTYIRAHYRVPAVYPVMFSDTEVIGEGRLTNLSVLGCTIECTTAPPRQSQVLLRLLLPDRQDSLPIKTAEVRWIHGNRVGVQFMQLERTANLRLHGFVWDRMFERLQALVQEVST